MKIGVISDTHNFIPPAVFDIFQGVDLLIHAGDIGGEGVLSDLRALAPVKAVHGNMDTFPVTEQNKQILFFELAGKQFCLTHIIGSPKHFAYQLFKANKQADIVISGHTHIASKTIINGVVFVDPGSASKPRGGKRGSVAIVNIDTNKIDVEFVYL